LASALMDVLEILYREGAVDNSQYNVGVGCLV